MKNFRRILSLVLALCLCFSLVVGASAEEAAHDHESENNLVWHLSEDGALTIGGTGRFCTLNSAEEQPWAEVREQIVSVHFDPDAPVIAKDIAYWFAGCTNLVYAEVPGFWAEIGAYAFADCDNLQELLILTRGVPVIDDTAFSADATSDLWIIVNSEESQAYVEGCNWYGRNITVENYGDVRTYARCGILGCTCSSCSWYKTTSPYDETDHITYEQCDSCSANEYAYGIRSDHTFSNGRCTVCGYAAPSCSHSRTYTTWSGCTWYSYCSDCDALMGTGVSHSNYAYGDWTYYSTLQHRRTRTCGKCGVSSYETGSHSTSARYTPYDDTQHTVAQYCAACTSDVGSISYAGHALTYGSWTDYSADQHTRTKSCATCGYSGNEYGDHADNNADGMCDACGHNMYVFSVTVPTSLPLVMDQYGNVTGGIAEIVNHSTGNVVVSAVTLRGENGWKIVPYATNMAHQKVDAKVVGFSLNGAATVKSAEEESLSLSGNWTIPQGSSLGLNYDAVVSAVSQAVKSETILSAIFVLKWS